MHAPTLIIIGYPRLFLSEVEQTVERKYASEMHRVEIQFRNSATHLPHWLLQFSFVIVPHTFHTDCCSLLAQTAQALDSHHSLPAKQSRIITCCHRQACTTITTTTWCCSYRCRSTMSRSRELQQPERFPSKCHFGGLVDLFIKDSLNHPGKKTTDQNELSGCSLQISFGLCNKSLDP